MEHKVNDLHADVVDLIAKVEFLKGEVEQANGKARAEGIEAGFKIFRWLMLRLHLNFDMKALEVLVMLEVVDKAVD